jgi:hypothetical protein
VGAGVRNTTNTPRQARIARPLNRASFLVRLSGARNVSLRAWLQPCHHSSQRKSALAAEESAKRPRLHPHRVILSCAVAHVRLRSRRRGARTRHYVRATTIARTVQPPNPLSARKSKLPLDAQGRLVKGTASAVPYQPNLQTVESGLVRRVPLTSSEIQGTAYP